MTKKVVFKVHSIRDYRGGAEDKITTWVHVDQLLYDGDAYAEMDSTVYDIEDFQDIHAIYLRTAQRVASMGNETEDRELGFEYEYDVYKQYILRLKKELQALQ